MKNALFAVLVATAAMAQEPFTVNHDRLGESVASYLLNNVDCPMSAFKADRASGAMICVSSDKTFTYAGVKHDNKRVTVLRDQVVMINLTFSHDQYNTVLNSLREKFGDGIMSFTEANVLATLAKIMAGKELTPREQKNVPARAANFKWSNGVSTIQLSEYDARDPSFESSNLTFSLDSAQREIRNNFDKHAEVLDGTLGSEHVRSTRFP